MKTFSVSVPVTQATGWQNFEVVASSLEDAVVRVQCGEGEIRSEDIDVKEMDWSNASAEPITTGE